MRRYLRPTHGTPQYLLKVGRPASEPTPALVLSKDWTVSPVRQHDGSRKYYLSYNDSEGSGDGDQDWVACASTDGSDDYGLF